MLIRFLADSQSMVWLTDEPQTALELSKTTPVIGITGPEPEYALWCGILYLAESIEAVDETYAKMVWCRFYGEAVKLAETKDWCLREMKKSDLPVLYRMYQLEDVRRYLEYPTGEDKSKEAWDEWGDAYIRQAYYMGEPAMWVLTDENEKVIGRLGMEWQTICGIEGYFLGYALLPEARHKGIVTQAASVILALAEERWAVTEIYLACKKENQASIACAKRLGFQLLCENQGVCVFCISVSME